MCLDCKNRCKKKKKNLNLGEEEAAEQKRDPKNKLVKYWVHY